MTSPLTALSPLDGRYSAKTRALQDHFSEFALMRERVAIEVAWLAALGEEPSFTALKAFSAATRDEMKGAVAAFGIADAERIKAIEATTNHDVKAVEYWLRERFAGNAEVAAAVEFIHFACTSEDINNLAHGRMLKGGRDQVLLPAIDRIITRLDALAREHAALAMLRETIEKCPDELWAGGAHPRNTWRIAYHALYYTHLYLMPHIDAFVPWEKNRADSRILWETEDGGPPVEGPFSREETIAYLGLIDAGVDGWVDALDLDSPESGIPWYTMAKLEHQLLNLRHLAGHVGQLSELVNSTGADLDWVSTG